MNTTLEENSNFAKRRLAVRPSYRQSFGLDNPPKNSLVKIKFLEGLKYFVVWLDCPDLENVVEMNFTTKNKALEYAACFGWCVQADR